MRAHPETQEDKEQYKTLYKTISSRSRSQSPASGKAVFCHDWNAGNCTLGKERRFAHSHPAAPSTEATKRGQKALLPVLVPRGGSGARARTPACLIRRLRAPTRAKVVVLVVDDEESVTLDDGTKC